MFLLSTSFTTFHYVVHSSNTLSHMAIFPKKVLGKVFSLFHSQKFPTLEDLLFMAPLCEPELDHVL